MHTTRCILHSQVRTLAGKIPRLSLAAPVSKTGFHRIDMNDWTASPATDDMFPDHFSELEREEVENRGDILGVCLMVLEFARGLDSGELGGCGKW
jgi:hypothetical protein